MGVVKLSEGFEYKGYWWRPSAPDKKVAGVLTYKAGDKILLELIGAFGGSEDAKRTGGDGYLFHE